MKTKSITKVFIANRGEIACRIIRACHEMGKGAVVGYSEADRHSLAVAQADQSVFLGAAPSAESYLNGEKVIAAAKATGCEAIHPGYGFLSENAAFAAAVEKAGLIFIGPTAKAMEALGDKASARAQAEKAKVSVPPGFSKPDATLKEWKAAADKIGYPVLVKAVAGGGGRGIRKVNKAEELEAALESAGAEAKAGFGDAEVLLEKCLDRARHIEVQVLGDTHGNVVALGERECSLQRRRQKVWEESPAPKLSEKGRTALLTAAVNLAKSVGYHNAGTLEFLVGDKEEIFFLEMNTRLQVEHPVTEMVTGLDLVKLQIHVAEGKVLPFTQEQVRSKGSAIEVRLCAEEPAEGFRPATGKLRLIKFPATDKVRIETGFQTGDEIPMHYDSLIAKIIAWGEDRAEAVGKLIRALEGTSVLGIASNRDFLLKLAHDANVQKGEFDISYVETQFVKKGGADAAPVSDEMLALATALLLQSRKEMPIPSGFRNNRQSWAMVDWALPAAKSPSRVRYKSYATLEWDFQISSAGKGKLLLEKGDTVVWEWNGKSSPYTYAIHGGEVTLGGLTATVKLALAEVSAAHSSRTAKGQVRSPMPGKVAKVLVGAGDIVKEGNVLAVLEAMKLEHSIRAPHAGTIQQVLVKAGQNVTLGAELILIEETPA